jgi:hypothetical protein
METKLALADAAMVLEVAVMPNVAGAVGTAEAAGIEAVKKKVAEEFQ